MTVAEHTALLLCLFSIVTILADTGMGRTVFSKNLEMVETLPGFCCMVMLLSLVFLAACSFLILLFLNAGEADVSLATAVVS